MKMIITEKQLTRILKKSEEIDEQDAKSSSDSSSSSSTSSSSSSSSSSSTSSTSSSPYSSNPTSTAPGGTSSGAEGKGQMDFPAYPEVNRWESGVTRGPANPIGNKPMEDRVKQRGKANPLR